MLFCRACGQLVSLPECQCCGFVNPLQQMASTSVSKLFTHKPTKHHALLRQAGATIQEKCPMCDAAEMVFHTAQLRGADEGQTVFYSCYKCGYKTRLNS